MKRVMIAILVLTLLFSGCAAQTPRDVTPEEIVKAYQDAGYVVWSDMYDETLDEGEIGYIQANHPDGDYIYFTIFATEKEAQAYKEEYYHPLAMGLFSAIYGEPSLVRWEVHGNIVAEYDQPEFYEVFENLLKLK